MPSDEEYKEIKMRLRELEKDYSVAVKVMKIGFSMLLVLLALFFGITYKQIGKVDQTAVSETTVQKLFESAKIKVETESAMAISIMKSFVKKTKSTVEDLTEEIQNASDNARKLEKDINTKIRKITTKGDNLIVFLNDYKKNAEDYLDQIKQSIPKLSPFSISDIVEDGAIVKTPWGTIKDWNIFLSPNKIEFYKEGVSFSHSYYLLGLELNATKKDESSWQISAISKHKFGQGTTKSPSLANYLLVPKGKKISVNN